MNGVLYVGGKGVVVAPRWVHLSPAAAAIGGRYRLGHTATAPASVVNVF